MLPPFSWNIKFKYTILRLILKSIKLHIYRVMGDVSSLGCFFFSNFFQLYFRVCTYDTCVSVLSHIELRKQPSGAVLPVSLYVGSRIERRSSSSLLGKCPAHWVTSLAPSPGFLLIIGSLRELRKGFNPRCDIFWRRKTEKGFLVGSPFEGRNLRAQE